MGAHAFGELCVIIIINNNLLISSAQVSTIRFSNARYISIEVDMMYRILYIDNSPQGVFQ